MYELLRQRKTVALKRAFCGEEEKNTAAAGGGAACCCFCHSTYVVTMHRYTTTGNEAGRRTENNDNSIKVTITLQSCTQHTNHNGSSNFKQRQ